MWLQKVMSPDAQSFAERHQVEGFPHISIVDPQTGLVLWRKEGWTQQSPVTAEWFGERVTDLCDRLSHNRRVQEMTEVDQSQVQMPAAAESHGDPRASSAFCMNRSDGPTSRVPRSIPNDEQLVVIDPDLFKVTLVNVLQDGAYFNNSYYTADQAAAEMIKGRVVSIQVLKDVLAVGEHRKWLRSIGLLLGMVDEFVLALETALRNAGGTRPSQVMTDGEQPIVAFAVTSFPNHSDDPPPPRADPDLAHRAHQQFRDTLVQVLRTDDWVAETGTAESVATLMIGDNPGKLEIGDGRGTLESLKMDFKDPSKRAAWNQQGFRAIFYKRFLRVLDSALDNIGMTSVQNAPQLAAIGAHNDVVPSPERHASTEANEAVAQMEFAQGNSSPIRHESLSSRTSRSSDASSTDSSISHKSDATWTSDNSSTDSSISHNSDAPWTSEEAVKKSMQNQKDVDPASVFPQAGHQLTLDIAKVFRNKKLGNRPRGSSGGWSQRPTGE
jgi:hypothetical protein